MSAQPYHYIAISAFDFMSAGTKADAITRLLQRTGESFLGDQIKANGGLEFSVYRVGLPVGAVYPIEDYRPAGEAAGCYSFSGRYRFISTKGRQVVVQPPTNGYA